MAACEKCEFDGMAMLKRISNLELEREELKKRAEHLVEGINTALANLGNGLGDLESYL